MKTIIEGGNAYQIREGSLQTAAVLVDGTIEDNWAYVTEMPDYKIRDMIRKLLKKEN